MLKKSDVLNYYQLFFNTYPDKRNLSEIITSLQQYDFDKKFSMSVDEEDYHGILVSKNYLHPEQIKEWDEIPEFLSIPELEKLNEKYGNKLTWKILDSSVTDDRLLQYEKKWNVDLPDDFRTFLKSYANLRCEIECDYYEDGENEIVDLQLPLMLYNSEMSDFERDMYLEPIKLLSDLGYILIAIRDDYEWWCLDCKSGKIFAFADDDDYSDMENIVDEKKLLHLHGHIRFENFNDFLKTCFGATSF